MHPEEGNKAGERASTNHNVILTPKCTFEYNHQPKTFFFFSELVRTLSNTKCFYFPSSKRACYPTFR